MVRAGSGKTTKLRRKRTRKLTKGFRLSRHNLFKQSMTTLIRARAFAFRDRRSKQRHFRRLWIIRINAGARQHDLSYSKLMHGLKLAGITVDRKILADLAATDANAFAAIVGHAKSALAAKA